MAMKTIIESISARAGGATEIVAIFADEERGQKVRVTTQVYNPTVEGVRRQLRLERSRLVDVDRVRVDIPIGEEFDIDVPDAAVETDPAEVARQAYIAAYQHFRAVRLQFDDGLVEAKAVEDARTAVKALFRAEYLGVV